MTVNPPSQDPSAGTGVVAWLAAVIAVVCIVTVSCCAIGGVYAYKLSMKNRVSFLVSKPNEYGHTPASQSTSGDGNHETLHKDKDAHTAVPAAAAGEVGWANVSRPFSASSVHDLLPEH